MSKNVIIIGGTGHLGVSLSNYLIKKKFNVFITTRKKKNNLSINEHIEIYLNTNIPILIEKSCGYNFMLYLNEYSTLIDLYRYLFGEKKWNQFL